MSSSPRRRWFTVPTRVLGALNVIGIGASLGAAAATGLGIGVGRTLSPSFVWATALTTFVTATLWAGLLRHPARIGLSNVRWGQLATLPLAYLSTMIVLCLAFPWWEPGEIFTYVNARLFANVKLWTLCSSLAAITLVVVSRSPRQTPAALDNSEWNEVFLGSVSLMLSFLAFAVVALRLLPVALGDTLGQPVVVTLALLGAFSGGLAAALALGRRGRRRLLLRLAETGRAPGYRVATSPEGKRLLQLAVPGHGYRVANIEEEVYLQLSEPDPEVAPEQRRARR